MLGWFMAAGKLLRNELREMVDELETLRIAGKI